MTAGSLAGAGGLARLVLRRDRLLIGGWLLLVVGVLMGAVAATQSTYPTGQERSARYDQILAVPMFMVFQGRAFDAGAGAIAAQQAFAATTLAAALGAALLVVRHTRGEEEAGRRELLGATGVGRNAPLAAVLGVALAGGLVIAAAGALALTATGLPPMGSAVLGAVAGAAAWVAAAMAALAAQVSLRATTAVTAAFGTFMVLHYVRGLAHLGGPGSAWTAWLTPNGLLEQARPYAGDRWWTLLLVTALAGVLIASAFAISGRRDLGAAALHVPRPGPASAPPGLHEPVRLAWRLQRTGLLAWAAALFVAGVAMGRAGSAAMTEYGELRWVREYAAAARIPEPADAFFVYVVFVFVFVTAAQAVLTVLRLRADEASGLADAVLATTRSRTRWMSGHVGVALAGPVLLQASLGLGLGAGAAADAGSLVPELGRALGHTLPLVPAVWVVVAVTVAVFGLRGRWAPVAGWLAVTVGIAGELAVKAGLPEVLYLVTSPFAHVNPYYRPEATTYLVLTALTGALVAVGASALRRRDIVAG